MRKNKYGDYYLGLDMGTSSVGWAVTDTNYNILKSNAKALWGIRLFEEAKSAAGTRLYRSQRRRIDRVSWRISILQELFSEVIAKVDPGFFMRLKESRLRLEDKKVPLKYNLFIDKNYTDIDFYKQYPTMYHLRYALATREECFDVRLLYLAIQHIAKHRGHFLFAGLDASPITDFRNIYDKLEEYIKEELELADWSCQNIDKMEEVLSNSNLNVTAKKKELEKLLPRDNKKCKALISFLSGGKAKMSELFDDENLKLCEKDSFGFRDDDFETIMPIIEADLGDRIEGIFLLKSIYDWSILAKILGINGQIQNQKYKFISSSKVDVYNQHREDLVTLKKILKGSVQYNKIFRMKKEGSYAYYISGKQSQEDFCKTLQKIVTNDQLLKRKSEQVTSFEQVKDAEDRLLYRIANGLAFPKQVTKENGIIPIQVNLVELDAILQNAEKYLPFLSEVDADGLTISDKIKAIVKFRIPYYVGPLAGSKYSKEKGRCWVVRKDEKIYPWNFDKVVDLEACAEKFIINMTAKCTYLLGEDVLPKNSLLYSEFMMRNELNSLTIDGERVSSELLNKIYNHFTTKNKITKKNIKEYLKTENIYCEDIGGIDDVVKSNLKSFKDFSRIFGQDYVMCHAKQIEDIIRWITLFCDEKDLLLKKIISEYPEISAEKLKEIKKLKYKDWGRLSAALLNGEKIAYIDDSTGEVITIISALRHTNKNFMELLSSSCEYKFIDKIQKFNKSDVNTSENITYKDVEKLYVSPAVKRSIWQTLSIIKELQLILGHAPKKVFLEMAREKQESQRTISRLNRLKELYKECKDEEIFLSSSLEEKTDEDLRRDKLYLYYTQLGRCMYTGERIEISDLFNDNLYDIDHIYPRSKTKDDSIDNRVLVRKNMNSKKSDKYPLNENIRSKMRAFWKDLYERGYISQKKYERLIRVNPLTDDELAGFINRQIVETRQSTKAVAELLQSYFGNDNVIFSKAGNVSDFRQKYGFIKSRDVNDLHHAKDAYLNIVVGNAYYTKFTKSPINYIKNNHDFKYSLNSDKFYNFPIERAGVIAWVPGEDGTIAIVKKMMSKNNILFTRMAVQGKGQIFDQNPVAKAKDKWPLKQGLPTEVYGGYNSLTTSYFALVESLGKKGKKQRSLEAVPIIFADKQKNVIEKYLSTNSNLVNPKIILPKIRKFSLLYVNGYPMHIASCTGKQITFYSARQLILPDDEVTYVKSIFNCEEKIQYNESIIYDLQKDETSKQIAKKRLQYYEDRFGISRVRNLKLYQLLVAKCADKSFYNRPASQYENLKNNENVFASLKLFEQIKVLEQIFKLFKCGSASANLKLLGLGAYCGIPKIGMTLKDKTQIILVNQSVTGVFEQAIDLLSV